MVNLNYTLLNKEVTNEKIFDLFYILLLQNVLIAEGSGPKAKYELFIGTRNTGNNNQTISVTKIGATWDQNYSLTSCCSGYNFIFNGSSINSDSPEDWGDGFDFINSYHGHHSKLISQLRIILLLKKKYQMQTKIMKKTTLKKIFC